MKERVPADYETFLREKRRPVAAVGFEAHGISERLYGFQRDVVAWACRMGRAALFEDCGLGKTIQQLEWARLVSEYSRGPVLILAPLAVAQQTVREGSKFGIESRYLRADDGQPGIVVTNYEMMDKFDARRFTGVVLDECFAGDTEVDVFHDYGSIVKRRIDDIRIGDQILNASGRDVVSDVHRREVPYGVAVTVKGSRIICSPNHPWFTQRGWVEAQDLEPGDNAIRTEGAVRMVYGRLYREMEQQGQHVAEVLRSILLSEMADATAGALGEGPQSGGGSEARPASFGLVEVRQSIRAGRIGSDSHTEAVDSTGPTDSRLSHALQARLGARRSEAGDRGGWVHPLRVEASRKGQEERREGLFSRVDSVEILKPGHPDLERRRSADGKLYFYDLGGTRHPSFSVSGCLVHNSSLLKAQDGKTRRAIIETFERTPYRLACTATPAPNDFMELGNHAQFLGVMTQSEMLSMYFVHDGGSVQDWRIKRHARDAFWKWVCGWAMMIRRPSDIGYEDTTFMLPPLRFHRHVIAADHAQARRAGLLFAMEAQTLQERRLAKRETISERAQRAAAIVAAEPGEQWLLWCNLNDEGDELARLIPGAVQVAGSDSRDHKEHSVAGFVDGSIRVLVSKPSMFGHGLNLQCCARLAFVGLSDSFEQFYQAVRRCWRFGQTRPVDCHIITSELEGAVVANIERKEADLQIMIDAMAEHMQSEMRANLHKTTRYTVGYDPAIPMATAAWIDPRSEHVTKVIGQSLSERFAIYHGDSCEIVPELPDASVDYSIFSPPFASLYTYSASDRDMGNCLTHAEFYEHFRFLVGELLRVTKPGRVLSFHCMNLPTTKARDGYIGISDFRGLLIKLFQDAGWIYHSEVVIWKDPVTAMQRTKALGLLHKQIRKDSAMSRQGLPDYLVTMRKPGINPAPITHDDSDLPVSLWQKYASPVWMDIDAGDTLQRESAREEEDEKHICPLQLGVIERAVHLWSRPNDVILSPFAGIGSEGYQALKLGRRFVGVELKESYCKQAVANLSGIEKAMSVGDLLSRMK